MLDPAADTLPKLILHHARIMPDAVAMRRKTLGIWQRITWADLAGEVRRIAAGLLASDLGDPVCIAAIGDNEPELFWAEYAIQAVGRAASCQFPDSPAEELLANLRDCRAEVVFAEDQEQCDKLLQIADAAGLRMIVFWDGRGLAGCPDPRVVSLKELQRRGDALLRAEPGCVDEAVARGSADDLAVVIYTSGTSGRPKGVRGSHRYLLDIADRWRRLLDARPGANYVSYISPAWATEQYLGVALAASLPLTVNFPEEPETVAADMREIGPDFLFYSPRQWEAVVSSTEARMRDASAPARAVYRWAMATLAAAHARGTGMGARRWVADALVGRALRDRLGLTRLKSAVNSGSTLSPEIYDFFAALGVRLRNAYGFTEVGILTATAEGDPSSTAGKLLGSAHGQAPLEMRIVDDEIQVRGGVGFGGYFGREESAAERLTADGWFRSGDAGHLDPEGRLVYLDRVDDLRRLSSGETVAPQYVETRIRLSHYIRDVIVVCDGQPAPGALIDIDMEMVGRWAEARQIAFTTQLDLSQHPAVCDLVEAEIVRVNAGLVERCRVARFINLVKPFDADEGELTRSRKLRRAVVERKYAALVAGLFGEADTLRTVVEVDYQDGRTRQLHAEVQVRRIGLPAASARGTANNQEHEREGNMPGTELTRRRVGLSGAAAALAGVGGTRRAAAVETYKVVSFLDYSGPFASRGKPVEQMQQLLVDWYNQTRGAERGVVIRFEPVDTGYDQGKTVQAYERAIQDPSLIGIVTFGSPNVIAIQGRLPESRIPAVHGGPAYSLMKKGSWVFTPLGDYARYYASAIAWRLKSHTGSVPLRVAFVTFDGSSGHDWADALGPRLQGMNAKLVVNEFIPPRALDVAVNVERVLDAKPDLVILASTDQLQPLLLNELKANQFDMGKVINSQHEGLGLLALLGVKPEVYEGTMEVTTENYADTGTEAFKIYDQRKSKYQSRWSADTLLHFPSVMVLMDAIDRAVEKKRGSRIAGADVYAELAQGTFDGRGLLGRIAFSNETDPTLGADSFVMLRQKGGKIVAETELMPLVK